MSTQFPTPTELTPELALDTCGREALEGIHEITHLLRWLQHPEAARGKEFYIPRGHPSGLGGRHIKVPMNFPVAADLVEPAPVQQSPQHTARPRFGPHPTSCTS